jgi:hypothetical protein
MLSVHVGDVEQVFIQAQVAVPLQVMARSHEIAP